MMTSQKVLLVDDQPANLAVLKVVLEDLNDFNIEITEASSGEQALSALLQGRFSLILLDVQMADMDGYEVAQLIKGKETTKNIPIIFITAINQDHRNVIRAYQSGAIDFLYKPYEPIILQSKMRILLELDRQQQALQRSLQQNQLYATVFEHTNDGALILDANGKVLAVNSSCCRLTQFESDEILNNHGILFKHQNNPQNLLELMLFNAQAKGRWAGEAWSNRRLSSPFAVEMECVAVQGSNNQAQQYIILFSDITARKQSEAQLRYLANYDGLTGLPNRSLFTEYFTRSLATAKRTKKLGAVLFIDLDKFKPVNDTLGHAAGDQVLKVVAKILTENIRESDLAARFAGDEFAVALDNLQSLNDAEQIAQKILNAINVPMSLNGIPVTIGASIGISSFGANNLDCDGVIHQADQAMYLAKQRGRNQYSLPSPLTNNTESFQQPFSIGDN